ncbi:acyl-CoA carboxylase subunit beta [Chloroflexota bacterium]
MDQEMMDGIRKLRELRERVKLGGGVEKIARQHEQGKLTARERLDKLLDPGSFVEDNMLVNRYEPPRSGAPADGIVSGHGTIDERVVCVYSQDATVLGGSMGPNHGYKMYRAIETAFKVGVPLIGLHESPGGRARKPETGEGGLGFISEKQGGSVWYQNTRASGVVPQIAAIMGPSAGVSAYSPALNDFIFMVDKTSYMFVTGPRIVKSVMSEDITMEELGGAGVHARVSGVTDFRVKSEEECFARIRKLLSFLPQNWKQSPLIVNTGDDPKRLDDGIAEVVPANPRQAYDMHGVIQRLVDNSDFLEVKAEFAGEIIVGFGRLAGQTVGIVANQPMVRAGAMTVNSSDKQARFIRFCDCFNIPLIILVDTPAYLPGSAQEHAGIIRHGAKVLYALCEAVVPRIAIVIRKCYGGALAGMGVTPGNGTDFVFLWPTVEAGMMGAEQAVELFYGEEIKKAENPEQYREKLVREYREQYANPFYEVSRAPFFNDVIEPRETRRRLIQTLELLRHKNLLPVPKRHGNIPL